MRDMAGIRSMSFLRLHRFPYWTIQEFISAKVTRESTRREYRRYMCGLPAQGEADVYIDIATGA